MKNLSRLAAPALFRLLGAPDDMIPLIRGFMTILYAGVPFVVVGMVAMASMRATGDTRLPSKLMIIASILNVALDPLFIFGFGPVPAFGLNGAAIAALLARSTIFIGALLLLRYRLDMVSFAKPEKSELWRSWKDVLHVGVPAAGTNVIVPVGAAVVTAMIARYGPDAVAGFGVASRKAPGAGFRMSASISTPARTAARVVTVPNTFRKQRHGPRRGMAGPARGHS